MRKCENVHILPVLFLRTYPCSKHQFKFKQYRLVVSSTSTECHSRPNSPLKMKKVPEHQNKHDIRYSIPAISELERVVVRVVGVL